MTFIEFKLKKYRTELKAFLTFHRNARNDLFVLAFASYPSSPKQNVLTKILNLILVIN